MAVPLERRLFSVLALSAVAAPLALVALGPRGLVVYAALWLLALVAFLAPRWPALRSERLGALALFATFAFFDNLDDLLGGRQEVPLVIVLATLAYLALRARDARALARTPAVWLLALFYAQQVVSAWFFGSDQLPHIVENRLSALGTVLAGAALVRQPGGRRLLLWLMTLGALVSVPIMAFELWRPDVLLFSFTPTSGPLRAGGLYGQANEVGTALSFAVAALLALRASGDLGRRGLGLLLGGCAFGILACASRGALAVAIALVAARSFAAAAERAGRAPIATALLAAGVLAVGLPLIANGAALAAHRLSELGFDGAERLDEVVSALGGSTDALTDDDSSRLAIARQGLVLVAERPLLGVGTGRFTIDVYGPSRAHVQFLEIVGENGLIGLALYLVFLLVLMRTALGSAAELRGGALFVLGAWLLTNFDNHDLLDYRCMLLPVAYVCGLPRARPVAAAAPATFAGASA